MDKFLFEKSRFADTVLLVIFYGLLAYGFQYFLWKTSLSPVLPSAETLERWDAGIYHAVARSGYTYNSLRNTNTGVYILLPWVWKMLHIGALGMALCNLAIFAIAFAVIDSIYPMEVSDKILYLTTPSLYFMYVPYTEALFCLTSAVSFYGIVRGSRTLTWTGLFFASLCRATAVFLIPALLVMELLSNDRKDAGRSIVRYLINYALPTLAGLAVFVLVQYAYIGQWFIYFKVQVANLGHELSWPALPFDNFYGENRVKWLCALAMLPCTIALVILANKAVLWLKKGEKETDKVWLLALGYLPIILFTMVFCNPKWGNERTNLLGIHRYVFCSAYIFVFLYKLVHNKKYGWKQFAMLAVVCNILWLTMGSYQHIRELLFYNLLTVMAWGYMLHANKRTLATALLCAINFFLQINLFQQYLTGLFTD